jgi:hypothetical protein
MERKRTIIVIDYEEGNVDWDKRPVQVFVDNAPSTLTKALTIITGFQPQKEPKNADTRTS